MLRVFQTWRSIILSLAKWSGFQISEGNLPSFLQVLQWLYSPYTHRPVICKFPFPTSLANGVMGVAAFTVNLSLITGGQLSSPSDLSL